MGRRDCSGLKARPWLTAAALWVICLFLAAGQALAEKVSVDKLEAQTGIRLDSGEGIVTFSRGDTLTGTVTNPDTLASSCRRTCPAKGESVTLTYEGKGRFLVEWGSGGKVGRFHAGVGIIDM